MGTNQFNFAPSKGVRVPGISELPDNGRWQRGNGVTGGARCIVKGCPVRFATGEDRPCLDHAGEESGIIGEMPTGKLYGYGGSDRDAGD